MAQALRASDASDASRLFATATNEGALEAVIRLVRIIASEGEGGGDGREGYRRNIDGDVLGVVLATCWGVAKATEG